MARSGSKILIRFVASLFWAGFLGVGVLGVGVARAEVTVEGAWIAEPPPGAMTAAGFMQLSNGGSSPRTLVAASSDACSRIEFHESVSENGIARMEELEKLAIPPHGTLRFALGGYHLMLIHPKALHVGEQEEIELVFANGEKLRVQAEVRKLSDELAK